MNQVAVLTGDIAHSTQLSSEKLNRLELELTKELMIWEENIFAQSNNFFFYRGDSFQLVTTSIKKVFEIALYLRLSAMMNGSDVRIAIGVGEMQLNSGEINHSNGDAFVYSGRSLDLIGKKMLVFASGNNIFDEPLNVMLSLAEPIISKWSVEKAEAVYYHLKGLTQKEIATKVTRSQVAIHKRLASANYDEIKQFLNYVEDVL